MQNVNQVAVVIDVINSFIDDQKLFTALDISNKVKEQFPNLRHREVRDVVRSVWQTDIEPNGYARTPIKVTLNDGSQVDALLYHPISDSWDLDSKYDSQQRSQSSTRYNPAVQTVPSFNSSDGSTTIFPLVNPIPGFFPSAPVSAPVSVAVNAAPVPVVKSPLDVWKDLFNTQDSLFKK